MSLETRSRLREGRDPAKTNGAIARAIHRCMIAATVVVMDVVVVVVVVIVVVVLVVVAIFEWDFRLLFSLLQSGERRGATRTQSGEKGASCWYKHICRSGETLFFFEAVVGVIFAMYRRPIFTRMAHPRICQQTAEDLGSLLSTDPGFCSSAVKCMNTWTVFLLHYIQL